MESLLNTASQQDPLVQSSQALPFPSCLIPLPFCYTLCTEAKTDVAGHDNEMTHTMYCSAVLDYHPPAD